MAFALRASDPKFTQYRSGVLTNRDCPATTRLNHAMVIVGFNYGDDGGNTPDDGAGEVECTVTRWSYSCAPKARMLADSKGLKNYWKMQNSWGSWWGDGGFVRFNMDETGDGVCGMMNWADYVNV